MSEEDVLILRAADGAQARLHRHGGHLLSWIPAGESEDRLYLSPLSQAAPGVAIRGGVPVIFPQFAGEGPLPKHGFARSARWSVQSAAPASATLVLEDNAETRARWPQAFSLQLQVLIGGDTLEIRFSVRNTGTQAFRFTAALHTYLRVNEIAEVALRGLQGLRYRDSAGGGIERQEQSSAVRFDGEVDRIYFDAPSQLRLRDGRQALEVRQSGFTDTVVWNPGATKAAALADLPAGDDRRFVCVEAACVGNPVLLASGASWHASQTLRALAGGDQVQ
ncbi:D-hexose-6-phosphate mutarotase [Stagnimonas aquatica]|uniref:Putative glucose-6-phosphate 1-epimerase n=1 Tax=Stagnimonas aquatica TaxID=2689987 RepID=A0A3N0VKQ5_9GAMM|nr:D-hexose-6-phosphate mutarotase [Stagnimonas aquatica]ROH93346.1 D-hexose-6-phosphate mutarotase [Stagnimonas aquatica]